MGLNIKNEETHKLVRELAFLTGESMTTAIRVAVQERTERVVIERQRGLADRLLSIGKAAAPLCRSRFAPRNMAICSMARTGCPNDSRYLGHRCHSAR